MTLPRRRIGSRACDGCKIRKVKCAGDSPCPSCVAVGVPCTFNKQPLIRGPKTLRMKTFHQIAQAGDRARDYVSPDAASVYCASSPASSNKEDPKSTPIDTLVLKLCVYRLRLFPVWPIVAVEEIMASLHRDPDDLEAYALANAVGAATTAQLRLRTCDNGDGDLSSAASMAAECQRAQRRLQDRQGQGPTMNLNSVKISFFLHAYHENNDPGGPRSLLYLREAITVAQILGLHKEATYDSMPAREQQIRQRILWLLYVTERGTAMFHKLPVVLKCNIQFLNFSDVDDEEHVLPAFKKLVTLFWLFDQSGAFDLLQNSDEAMGMRAWDRTCFDRLQTLLREAASEEAMLSNDVQAADICATRRWMQAILWRASMSGAWKLSTSHQQATPLSHPIQIAKEFLETISSLPSAAVEAHGPAMEFKIYEIARTVSDAVHTGLVLPRGTLDRSWDVLDQLQKKLASYRGGNRTLLSLLRARIAEIPDETCTPLSLSSLPAQEIDDEKAPQLQAAPEPSTRAEECMTITSNGAQMAGIPMASPYDLFDQIQGFNGSFDDVESTGSLELLFTNNAPWDPAASWDWTIGASVQ